MFTYIDLYPLHIACEPVASPRPTFFKDCLTEPTYRQPVHREPKTICNVMHAEYTLDFRLEIFTPEISYNNLSNSSK